MLFNVKGGCISFPDAKMEYVCFGCGEKTLIFLPGLGDGLRTVKGTALPMAFLYRKYAKYYTVYMFSRKSTLPEGCSTRDMARHQKEAMDILGIDKADIIGVSMGGMISQFLAADYPEKVGKLAIIVSTAKHNAILDKSVPEWIDCAKRDDYKTLMDSNLRLIYSPEYYRKNRWMIPIVAKLTRPSSYDRFLIQAQACLSHNALSQLCNIKADTLVVGGEKDMVLGGDASRELAAEISGAKLIMYPQWGHGLYEEAKDFNDRVFEFLLS